MGNSLTDGSSPLVQAGTMLFSRHPAQDLAAFAALPVARAESQQKLGQLGAFQDLLKSLQGGGPQPPGPPDQLGVPGGAAVASPTDIPQPSPAGASPVMQNLIRAMGPEALPGLYSQQLTQSYLSRIPGLTDAQKATIMASGPEGLKALAAMNLPAPKDRYTTTRNGSVIDLAAQGGPKVSVPGIPEILKGFQNNREQPMLANVGGGAPVPFGGAGPTTAQSDLGKLLADLGRGGGGTTPPPIGSPPITGPLGNQQPAGSQTSPNSLISRITQTALEKAATPPAVQAMQSKTAENVATNEDAMQKAYQGMPQLYSRVNALQDILGKYRTNKFAEQKADIAAALDSIGITPPAGAMQNAENFQRFTKEQSAALLDQLRTMFANSGMGQVRVAEIQQLIKSLGSPTLTPAANRAIIGQMKGLLDYQKQHYEDYSAWRKQNPNSINPSADFEIPWQKQNDVNGFIQKATNSTAVLGAPIPPADKLPDGYMAIGTGKADGRLVRWNKAANHWEEVGE